ncbi:MAG: hypothetical protein ABJH06_17740 [Paraglaciecola sp.]|uniref:hypothetical protein n=1 Tax=Paraglaciecola sp. TaxID=1920173 RepID=UPI003296B800
MKFIIYLGLTLPSLLMSDLVLAQDNEESCSIKSGDDADKKAADCISYKLTRDQKASSATNLLKGLSYDASTKDNKAKIEFDLNKGKNKFKFDLQRSFEGSFDSQEYLNFDGIPSQTKVSFTYKRFIRINGLSDKDIISLFKTRQQTEIILVNEKRDATCKDTADTRDICEKLMNAYKDAVNKSHILVASDKNVLTLLPTVSMSYLQSPHSFYDFETLSATEKKYDGFEFTVGASILESKSLFKWDFNLGFQRGRQSREGDTSQTFCSPFEESDSVSKCATAYQFNAIKVEKLIPSITYSKLFVNGLGPISAVQVSIKHFVNDIKTTGEDIADLKDNTTVSIPVELIKYNDGLSGGIKFTYNTHPKEGVDNFNAGIYLSAPLSPF